MKEEPMEFDVQNYLRQPFMRILVPEDDGSFRAEIREFPGCIALGETEEEALASLKNVAESWVEAMRASGQPLPEPFEPSTGFSGRLALRLPKSLHRKAAYAAEQDGVSLNQFIASCVAERVGERKSAPGFRPWEFVLVGATHVLSAGLGSVPGSISKTETNSQSSSPWVIGTMTGGKNA